MDKLEINVISLPNALDRRTQVAASFADCPYPWSFVDASDGSRTEIPYRPSRAIARMGRELKSAEVGCFDSHYRALRSFAESGATQMLLVVEDDVVIDFGFPFEDLIDAMTSAGVDFIRLYSRRVPAAKHVMFWRNRWLVRYRWEPFGTQCYLVSQAGARHLVGRIKFIGRPVDDEFDRFWENGLPPYALFPHPVLELSSASSIVRSADASHSRGRRARYRVRRLVDRVSSIAYSLRGSALDQRFAAALARTDDSGN
jgi:glycosyl transferase family 25